MHLRRNSRAEARSIDLARCLLSGRGEDPARPVDDEDATLTGDSGSSWCFITSLSPCCSMEVMMIDDSG